MRLSPFLLIASLLLGGCFAPYRTGAPEKSEGGFIRVPREDKEPDASKPFKDKNRYHSVYHTDNPYYDARNLILDGDLSKALELLTVDTHSLDYPNRAAMWVFITMCKLNQREEAMQFLKEFVVPISLDPSDTGVISTMLQYFLGSLKDNDLYMRFKNWDELDHCPAFYYFGAYKKYYAEDFVTGNDYIGRSYRTRMINYSEFKFASVEVRGYVARDPGQYTDFPLNKAMTDEMAVAAELAEGYVAADDNRALSDGFTGEYNLDDYEFNNYLEQTDSEYGFTEGEEEDKEYLQVIPENLKRDQYVVPAPDGMGWEVLELMDLKKVLIEEALSMLDNLRGGNDYFMMRDDEEAQYFPTTRAFNSYFSRLEDYLKDSDRYMDDYGLDYGTVTLYLREGDILTGCVVPCRVYNVTFDTYTDDVLVSFNLLFAVNEDRSVELRHQVISILADLRELKNKDQPEPPNVGQSDFY